MQLRAPWRTLGGVSGFSSQPAKYPPREGGGSSVIPTCPSPRARRESSKRADSDRRALLPPNRFRSGTRTAGLRGLPVRATQESLKGPRDCMCTVTFPASESGCPPCPHLPFRFLQVCKSALSTEVPGPSLGRRPAHSSRS